MDHSVQVGDPILQPPAHVLLPQGFVFFPGDPLIPELRVQLHLELVPWPPLGLHVRQHPIHEGILALRISFVWDAAGLNQSGALKDAQGQVGSVPVQIGLVRRVHRGGGIGLASAAGAFPAAGILPAPGDGRRVVVVGEDLSVLRGDGDVAVFVLLPGAAVASGHGGGIARRAVGRVLHEVQRILRVEFVHAAVGGVGRFLGIGAAGVDAHAFQSGVIAVLRRLLRLLPGPFLLRLAQLIAVLTQVLLPFRGLPVLFVGISPKFLCPLLIVPLIADGVPVPFVGSFVLVVGLFERIQIPAVLILRLLPPQALVITGRPICEVPVLVELIHGVQESAVVRLPVLIVPIGQIQVLPLALQPTLILSVIESGISVRDTKLTLILLQIPLICLLVHFRQFVGKLAGIVIPGLGCRGHRCGGRHTAGHGCIPAQGVLGSPLAFPPVLLLIGLPHGVRIRIVIPLHVGGVLQVLIPQGLVLRAAPLLPVGRQSRVTLGLVGIPCVFRRLGIPVLFQILLPEGVAVGIIRRRCAQTGRLAAAVLIQIFLIAHRLGRGVVPCGCAVVIVQRLLVRSTPGSVIIQFRIEERSGLGHVGEGFFRSPAHPCPHGIPRVPSGVL